MKNVVKRCVLYLQLSSTAADDCNSFGFFGLSVITCFIVLQRNCKLKQILWCFLFYKENVTLLQVALKKLLTSPVIM